MSDGFGLPSIGPLYNWRPSGAMQSQLAVTMGSVVTLTVPTGTQYAIICVRTTAGSAINYSYDGTTTPTTGVSGN